MAADKAVNMLDGRTVLFGSRMKVRKEIISDHEVRFDFSNGESLVFDLREVSPDTLRLLALHGAKQKIGDEGADADTTGQFVNAVKAMIDRLYSGTAFDRQGGGGFQDTVLIEALVKVSGQSRDEVSATLKGMSAAEKLALRQIPEVANAISEIEAERAKGIDKSAIAAKFGL